MSRFRKGGKELENKSTYPESPKNERGRHINRVAAILIGIYCSVITAMPAFANSQTIIHELAAQGTVNAKKEGVRPRKRVQKTKPCHAELTFYL